MLAHLDEVGFVLFFLLYSTVKVYYLDPKILNIRKPKPFKMYP